MSRHHVRITRMIAAVLAFALVAQVAEAQVLNCVITGGMAPGDNHSAMIHHQHRQADGGSASTRSGSHSRSSGAAGCDQTMLCANVATIADTAMRVFQLDSVTPQILFGSGVLEARIICPDPPPPRV
jgi:hypothetical protein